MAEEEEYTPEQKRKIARHFVLVSPPGEVTELVKDLRGICGKKLLSDEWLQSAMTEYNKRGFVTCEGDSLKVICCPQGEVSANQYLNPEKRVVCKVNPVTQRVTQESNASQMVATGTVEEYRKALSSELKSYLGGFYEDGTTNPSSTARGMGSVYASNEGQIAIVISYNNLNVSNFWTGSWQSEWNLNVSSKGSTKIEGRIRLRVHYYEDGNVQLDSTFTETGEVDVTSDIAGTAKSVVNTVQTLENDFQKRLEKFYAQMHETAFKSMRRFLPKTGTKMDWRASVHKLAAEASSG